MDPLVRQAALEELLKRFDNLAPEEKIKTLNLGLTDPDLETAEMALKFVVKNQLIDQFKKELMALIQRFLLEEDEYYQSLAQKLKARLA